MSSSGALFYPRAELLHKAEDPNRFGPLAESKASKTEMIHVFLVEPLSSGRSDLPREDDNALYDTSLHTWTRNPLIDA